MRRGGKDRRKSGFSRYISEKRHSKGKRDSAEIKGVNWHDSYPDTGFYASRTQMIKDIILMKKHNINAVHTSF